MSGGRQVLSGFAASRVLAQLSFTEPYVPGGGDGSRHRTDVRRSLDFRRYIQRPNASTRPLTFNLRPDAGAGWRLEQLSGGQRAIVVAGGTGRAMSRLDRDHRLAHVGDLDVALPFMAYVGLSPKEERDVSALLDDGDASVGDFACRPGELCGDLAADRPDMYVALILRNDPASPWYRQLDLGARAVSGLSRKASLRTMCKGARPLVAVTAALGGGPDDAAASAMAFWRAVRAVLPEQWSAPRRHVLGKGVGVYALMQVAADMVSESPASALRQREFEALLSDFAPALDSSGAGPLGGLTGDVGAAAAVAALRSAREAQGGI